MSFCYCTFFASSGPERDTYHHSAIAVVLVIEVYNSHTVLCPTQIKDTIGTTDVFCNEPVKMLSVLSSLL